MSLLSGSSALVDDLLFVRNNSSWCGGFAMMATPLRCAHSQLIVEESTETFHQYKTWLHLISLFLAEGFCQARWPKSLWLSDLKLQGRLKSFQDVNIFIGLAQSSRQSPSKDFAKSFYVRQMHEINSTKLGNLALGLKLAQEGTVVLLLSAVATRTATHRYIWPQWGNKRLMTLIQRVILMKQLHGSLKVAVESCCTVTCWNCPLSLSRFCLSIFP